ncbi:MAG: efflux RND transporter periplasmic adaptor subunit [Candidatus Pacebacteria bacterium]|nr:efflux RND transporter periplasmic adaptor subunit [Candidatus Paceibacterota bacterium]
MFGKILEHRITLIVVSLLVIAVVVIGGYYILRPESQNLSAVPAAVTDIQESVTASGNIDSNQDVSLSFQNSGTIAAINVAVGDHVTKGETLASLDNSGLLAQLEGAQADVLAAQANLATLQNGATSQTLAVYSQGVSTAASALSTAIEDSYLKASDAIQNKSDALFQNGTSANPTILIPTDSYSTGLALNNSRVDISTRVAQWKSDLSGSTTASDSLINESSATLSIIKGFLDTLTTETTRLTTGNSGLPQSQISAYVAVVNAAESETNAALTEFNGAVQAYRTSNDQLAVVQASSTPENIQAAEATVAKAEANVSAINSQITNGSIVAPFDGIVASVDPKVGEAYSAATPAIDLVSAGNYKIDLMIPENEVAKIKVGDTATLTFDANADLSATATIASIDLAPTVTNGISAYKTTLYLNGTDPQIRAGMTANATILGRIATNVLAVPSSAIISENGDDFVLAQNSASTFVQQKVTVGISGNGETEVRSGLSAGQLVATFGK